MLMLVIWRLYETHCPSMPQCRCWFVAQFGEISCPHLSVGGSITIRVTGGKVWISNYRLNIEGMCCVGRGSVKVAILCIFRAGNHRILVHTGSEESLPGCERGEGQGELYKLEPWQQDFNHALPRPEEQIWLANFDQSLLVCTISPPRKSKAGYNWERGG